MKKTRFLAILLVFAISISIFAIHSSAADEVEEAYIEIIFLDENVSDEFKEKATAHLLSGGAEDEGAATYGILCKAFGHVLETGTTTQITHKVNATAPRCLQRTYEVSACTRCDYTESTLLSSTYIYCCS